jgi:virulence-associated protein VapD
MYALSFDMVVSDLKQYYDDQITAGNMTTQHVKNTLRKILRDEFNIR